MKTFRKRKGKYVGYTKQFKDRLIRCATMASNGDEERAIKIVNEQEKFTMQSRNIKLHNGTLIRIENGKCLVKYGNRVRYE